MGFIFQPEVLHDIAKRAIGKGHIEKTIRQIHGEMLERFPGHVVRDPEWIFNVAGGATGQMMVLHASITEYVMIFGTPIGTEGFSGRFAAEDHFMILDGEQWCYREGGLEKEVYRPGDRNVLPRGAAKGYRMPDKCFALEYARGIIPAMLPFGLADAISSTLDAPSVARTFRVYTKAVVGNLVRGKI
jgi:C-8 sterol isomerase